MKRLILGFTLAVTGVALLAPAAQGSTLTMKEAKEAASMQAWKVQGAYYYPQSARNCSRLASNRIRCTVRMSRETYWTLKTCNFRVEVVERDEISVRTLRRKCSKRDVPYLSWERAQKAAARKMDPKAMHPDYEMGFGGGSFGNNRYRFDATWVNEKNQICVQSAKVRLVKKKVLVNVGEIACVDDPAWPRSAGV